MAEDITRHGTLENVHEEDRGTGIYWFVDGSGDRFEQVFVPSVTIARARELAADFEHPGRQRLDAYRWVPDQVESVQSLLGKLCGGKCTKDLDCLDNACRCIRDRCRRK